MVRFGYRAARVIGMRDDGCAQARRCSRRDDWTPPQLRSVYRSASYAVSRPNAALAHPSRKLRDWG